MKVMVVGVFWRRVVERPAPPCSPASRLRRLLLVVASDGLTTAVLVVRVMKPFSTQVTNRRSTRGTPRHLSTTRNVSYCAPRSVTKMRSWPLTYASETDFSASSSAPTPSTARNLQSKKYQLRRVIDKICARPRVDNRVSRKK